MSKGAPKQGIPNVSLNMSLTIHNSANTLAMNVIFFSKCSKFEEDFESGEKNSENVFIYLDNCIWYSSCIFQIKQREYLWSVVNVLIKTCKSSNISKREVSQVSFAQNDKDILWKYSHGDFTSVLDFLTCWP